MNPGTPQASVASREQQDRSEQEAAQAQTIRQALDRAAPDILTATAVPGLAVALQVGENDFCCGYGSTSVEDPLPVTAETIFQIGSVSKTFVGVIAGQLEQEGRLDLEWPVVRVLGPECGLDERILIRHLLTHASGIDAQYMIGSARALLAGHAEDSIARSLAHLRPDGVIFAPGSDFSYSGPGFMVAAAVLEHITGASWEDILWERVLRPAGMRRTFTRADQAITYRVAAPHDVTADRARVNRNEGWQLGWQLPGWDVPGGGVLSTAADLLRYSRYCWENAERFGFFRDLAGRGIPDYRIAYAWMSEPRRGRTFFGHGGLTFGYASRLMTSPEERVTYALLTNSAQGAAAVDAAEEVILEALYGARIPPQVAPERLEEFGDCEGVYDQGFHGLVRLRTRADGTGMEMFPVGEQSRAGSFVIEGKNAPLLVPRDDGPVLVDPGSDVAGNMVAVLRDEHGAVRALRIGERICARVDT